MKFRTETITALDRWLSQVTWRKDHPYDNARFYAFVDSLRSDIKNVEMDNEAAVMNLMCERFQAKHGELGADDLESLREDFKPFRAKIWVIFDFLLWRANTGAIEDPR